MLPLPNNPLVDAELSALARGRSHPDFLCLRAGYSPVSRYPATDFTPWIAAKLLDRKYDDIAYLLARLTEGNPGLGLDWTYWHERAADLCSRQWERHVRFSDSVGMVTLRAAAIACSIHSQLDGFLMVGDEIAYLARAVVPYDFQLVDVGRKIEAANAFIARMRKETKGSSAAWDDVLPYSSETVARTLQTEPPAAELRNMLTRATVGSRQVFFGSLGAAPGQGAFEARRFGVNEDFSYAELAELGLGQLRADPDLILMTYTKTEILAAASGLSVKPESQKKTLVKRLIAEAPTVVARLTDGRTVLEITAEAKAAGLQLVAWLAQIQGPLILVLAFS